MIRKQVYLEERHDRALKAMARATGQPEAAHIRAALDAYLATRSSQRQAHADPFGPLVGLAEGGPDDVALNHDHYLYGWEKRE